MMVKVRIDSETTIEVSKALLREAIEGRPKLSLHGADWRGKEGVSVEEYLFELEQQKERQGR